jgi:omega-amidase
MRISLVQTSLAWEQPDFNLAQLEAQIFGLRGATDLVVLPEMFTTGFTMQGAAAAALHCAEGVSWMRKMALQLNACVVGSMIYGENGRFFNRLFWVYPDGHYLKYDKRHLFSLAGEPETYIAGTERLIVEWKGVRICPLICYDLRFPVWSRNVADYDMAIYVSNWPAVRADAWATLLKARAIENQCAVVGVNIVGQDGNGHTYMGGSVVHTCDGSLVTDLGSLAQIKTVVVDFEKQKTFRTRYPFLDDRDKFTIIS